MPPSDVDFLTILKAFGAHEVDFILVGGVCAVLHGAPVTTFDVDIVYSVTSKNTKAVEAALTEVGAYYRGRGEQKLPPDAQQLMGGGHHLFSSACGPVDLLSFIGNRHDFGELLANTVIVELDDLKFPMLSLSTLLSIKQETNREKDAISIPILQRLLDELGET